ncbi:MAG TPA: peptidoglycan DD-metalloendopeptidase family protein [Vicinamibacterales bacterium]
MSPAPRLATLIVLALIAAATGGAPAAQERPADATRRIADRLAALRKEAASLSTQEKSILNDLRTLELERQIKTEELAGIDAELEQIQKQIADATARAEELRARADQQEPDVAERLVRVYKMGRAGYWRLLLDADDLQSIGRALRTASVLDHLDRTRIENHARTIAALEQEKVTLEDRKRQADALRTEAAAARGALDRAVASRAELVKSIETRRDLAAELAAELDAAYLRLQSAIAQNQDLSTVYLPMRPFKGALPWPADGFVVSRFGREVSSRMPGIDFSRNGIEISLAEGRPVAAVHEGVVTHAGPFSAYGQLVIVDHGGGAVSLYGHLATISVSRGDRVAAGTNVGTSGRNTAGNPSVYFELRIDGQPVDPLQWLRPS